MSKSLFEHVDALFDTDHIINEDGISGVYKKQGDILRKGSLAVIKRFVSILTIDYPNLVVRTDEGGFLNNDGSESSEDLDVGLHINIDPKDPIPGEVGLDLNIFISDEQVGTPTTFISRHKSARDKSAYFYIAFQDSWDYDFECEFNLTASIDQAVSTIMSKFKQDDIYRNMSRQLSNLNDMAQYRRDHNITDSEEIKEADISIDTELMKNGDQMSAVESKLLEIISIMHHFDNLDGIKLDYTPKGNIWVTENGKDLITINGSTFTEDELYELKDLGYWVEPTFDDEEYDESQDLKEETKDKKYKCIKGMSHPNMGRMFKKGQVYKLTDDKGDEVTLGGWNINKKYLNTHFEEVKDELKEAVVPASQLDFKHQQLAKVQDDIKVISELKAEDTSNDLYTKLLDSYDKIVTILTDSIAEDPVGTVVGDGFDTGLETTEEPIEEPVNEPTEEPIEEPEE